MVRNFYVPAGASRATVSAVLDELVERHETLRTTFHAAPDGEAYQVVHPTIPVPTRELCCADDSVDSVVDETTAELRTIGFDLAEPGLVRAVIVTVADAPRQLLVATHHIVVDGWSWQVLRREFRELVRARIDGVAADLPPVAWQPVDQAEYEHSEPGRRANAAALRYWDRRIAGMPDRVLPSSGSPVSAQHMATLRSPAAAKALSWLGARYRVADSTLVLAMFGAVLGVLTGRDGSTVMTMAANRLNPRTRDLVACLAQYTAVHIDLAGDPTFAELLGRAGSAVLTAYRHGHYDFQAMKALEAEQAGRRGVVFSQPAGLTFIRYAEPPGQRADPGPAPQLSTTDSELRVEPIGGGCARGVVLLSVRPSAEATELELLGDADALSTDELAALLRAIENLVVAGVTDPDQRLSVLLSGLRPAEPGPDWALVDDCWVCLPEVARALGECPGVTAAAAFGQDGTLVAYLSAADPPPEHELREHVLRAAAAGRAVIAPHRYVTCPAVPADVRDPAAWRRQAGTATRSS